MLTFDVIGTGGYVNMQYTTRYACSLHSAGVLIYDDSLAERTELD